MRRIVLIFLLCFADAARAQKTAATTLIQYLSQTAGLSTKQLAAVERGEPVVTSPDTPQPREVTIVGVITSSASRDAILRRMRERTSWLKSATRTRLGLMSDPPVLSDMQSLVIDPGILEELRKCRPGSCAVKLPAPVMDEVRTQLANASDPLEQVTIFTRRRLLTYVQDYRAHGDSAMVQYDDNDPVRASNAFAYLLWRSSLLPQFVPAFAAYLAGFPRVPLEGVEDGFFWAQESEPGLRSTITLTHAAIYSPAEMPGLTLMAEKEIYSSHYLEAALVITAVVDRPAGGSYLLTVRRMLFDALPGGLFGVRRRAVGGLRERGSAELLRLRALVER